MIRILSLLLSRTFQVEKSESFEPRFSVEKISFNKMCHETVPSASYEVNLNSRNGMNSVDATLKYRKNVLFFEIQ